MEEDESVCSRTEAEDFIAAQMNVLHPPCQTTTELFRHHNLQESFHLVNIYHKTNSNQILIEQNSYKIEIKIISTTFVVDM